jgi:hypothetical protein
VETTMSPRMKTKRQLKALAKARASRATAKERTPPEGYRSVEHFLDDVREFCGRRLGATLDLARYLRRDESSVRRWIKREKIPLQETVETIHLWMVSKKP